MLWAAMLAVVLAAAAPAFAQGYEYQDADPGDVTNEGSGGFSVSGDDNTFEDVNIAQCTAVLNQVNTGNQQVQQAVQQYGGYYSYQYADQDATQEIDQDASVEQYCAQAVGDVTLTAAAPAAPAAAAPAAAAPAETLPATGGISLLAVGAGVLLVCGGLVVRRFVR